MLIWAMSNILWFKKKRKCILLLNKQIKYKLPILGSPRKMIFKAVALYLASACSPGVRFTQGMITLKMLLMLTHMVSNQNGKF